MRFMLRGLTGLILGLVTLALLLLAAGSVTQAMRERAAQERQPPRGQERQYAVNVVTLQPGTLTPSLSAYGEVIAARTLDIRAGAAGALAELAPGFREGGSVRAGERLYRIDPADAEAALRAAEADLREAEAERAEAEAALPLARLDREAAADQRDLRRRALERQQGLQGRGVGTAPELEAAELALSQAEQTHVGRAQAEAQAEARIARAEIALERSGIARDQAARRLSETEAMAPFDGILAAVAARPGMLVGTNELLAKLIDPDALEVAFRVTGAEFARLHGADGALMTLPVTLDLALGAESLTFPGRLERAGAAAGAGQAGRILYAGIEDGAARALRPGDFVAIAVDEPPLEGVARLPAAAAGPDGSVLVVGPDDRLDEAFLRILRREGDELIVADAPWGAEIVAARAAQLAPGIRVRPIRPDPPDLVTLDPEMRASLVAAVEASDRFPGEMRVQLLDELQGDAVPRSLLDRINTEIGG